MAQNGVSATYLHEREAFQHIFFLIHFFIKVIDLIVSCTDDSVVKTIPIYTDQQKPLKAMYYACQASIWRYHFVKKPCMSAHISID